MASKNMWDFNLQLFAENSEGQTEATQASDTTTSKDGENVSTNPFKTNSNTQTEENKEVKTYTEDEVRELLQKEADRRVSEAYKKWRKEMEKLKKEFELSQLSEKERIEAEKRMKEEELKQKEMELKKKEVDLETTKYLAENQLPSSLLEIVEPIDDFEKRKAFIEMYKETLEKEVQNRIKELEKGTFKRTTQNEPPTTGDPVKDALRQAFNFK